MPHRGYRSLRTPVEDTENTETSVDSPTSKQYEMETEKANPNLYKIGMGMRKTVARVLNS